jgi:hypothetical protein
MIIPIIAAGIIIGLILVIAALMRMNENIMDDFTAEKSKGIARDERMDMIEFKLKFVMGNIQKSSALKVEIEEALKPGQEIGESEKGKVFYMGDLGEPYDKKENSAKQETIPENQYDKWETLQKELKDAQDYITKRGNKGGLKERRRAILDTLKIIEDMMLCMNMNENRVKQGIEVILPWKSLKNLLKVDRKRKTPKTLWS